ncbi:mmpl domain protein [Nannochloropsis gaditana CCMP526]|uniref:mmpl domain protein n=1 Tax=Nannochloropsis gaditana (strain CCMP526) TaxID=1093141 RepID=UPI00029F7D5B|nr:mmpl domain protein [Nannochloropsis gaditana CCMP526]EKU23135.1 mmpl domain protein [Nannochloropsis gaditana CCMP526]|eukprot:XP_005852698.1 mmpl domain protein [Nannochloropsis gaditana CCMP526]
MLIPLLTITVTLLGQFLIMYPIAQHVDVVSFAPTVMASLSIAMGIDYSLFQLTRFMDGVAAGKDLFNAVCLMTESAGYIILVSGSTLCVSFLGLVFLPMEILRSLGLAASITILTALSVNLTLLPALLLVLGPALLAADAWMKRGWARGKAALWGRRGRRKGRRKGAGKGGWEAPLLEGATDKEEKEQRVWKKEEAMEENSEEMDDGGYDCDESAPLKKGCWLGLARLGEGREGTEREVDGSIAFISHKPYGLGALLLLLALALPVAVQLKDMETSGRRAEKKEIERACGGFKPYDVKGTYIEFDLMLPFGSGSYNTLETISSNYGGAGVVFPYKVIFIDSEDIFTPQSYAAMNHVLASLVESAPPLELMDVTGIMVLGGQVGKKGGREGGKEGGSERRRDALNWSIRSFIDSNDEKQ